MRRFVQAFSAFPADPALPAAVAAALPLLPERYNISKGQPAGVIFHEAGDWRLRQMSWGLIPSWEKQSSTPYSTQTARLLHAPDSRLYRRAWRLRRCVLPLNGYYKWDRQSSPRQPYFIQAADGGMLFAAALWSLWGAGSQSPVWSFSVLTHDNPAIPLPLVPDGPRFLPAARLGEWMIGDTAGAGDLLLQLRQPRLEAYAVSRRVGDRRLDDYSLLEPLLAVEEFDAAYEPDEHNDDDEEDDVGEPR